MAKKKIALPSAPAAPISTPAPVMEFRESAAEWVELDKIKGWDRNPRTHDIDAIADSISRFGFGAPIVARRSGEIIAGHGRFLAAKQLGLIKVPVRFMDLTEKEAHLLVLADNRLTEKADWTSTLGSVLSEFNEKDRELIGWSPEEFASLVSAISNDGQQAIDNAKPATENPATFVQPTPAIFNPTEQTKGVPNADAYDPSVLTPSDISRDKPELQAFLEARKKMNARTSDKAEINYWLCLVFQSYDQKMAFLKAVPNVPTKYGMYVDGQTLAQAIGIEVPPNTSKPFHYHTEEQLTSRVLESEKTSRQPDQVLTSNYSADTNADNL